MQARAEERGGPPGYDGFCRDRGLGAGPGRALRFRAPDDGSTGFDDLVRGHVSVGNKTIEDFVLLRANGTPTFLLANLCDDADMGITHVIRGEEHVNGTPKYLLIGEALGLEHRPVFAHLPILVNEARKKLSKRRDSVSVASFRDEGYLPEAMVNYLALLGWGPSDGVEQRPLSEIVDLFRLEDVTPSPAFFDVRKLQAFNGDHIRALTADEFLARARPYLTRGAETEAVLAPIAELVRDRVRLLTEVEPMVAFLLPGELEVDEAAWAKAAKLGDRGAAMLDAAIAGLAELRVGRGVGRGRARRRRPVGGLRQPRGPHADVEGPGAGAGGHHRPVGGPAALRIAGRAGARTHARAPEGRTQPAVTTTVDRKARDEGDGEGEAAGARAAGGSGASATAEAPAPPIRRAPRPAVTTRAATRTTTTRGGRRPGWPLAPPLGRPAPRTGAVAAAPGVAGAARPVRAPGSPTWRSRSCRCGTPAAATTCATPTPSWCWGRRSTTASLRPCWRSGSTTPSTSTRTASRPASS